MRISKYLTIQNTFTIIFRFAKLFLKYKIDIGVDIFEEMGTCTRNGRFMHNARLPDFCGGADQCGSRAPS